MDTATPARPEWSNALSARPARSRQARRSGRPPAAGTRPPRSLHAPALGLVLVATLLLRLWGFHVQVPWEDPHRPNEMRQIPAPGVPEWLPA